MKQQLLLFVMMLLPMVVNSAVLIDGVYYELDAVTETAKVSRNTPGTYYSRVDISIPSSVNYNGKDYTVTGIGKWAFDNAVNLRTITIPQSVTFIEENAFYNCSSLINITIPDKVHSIYSNAFQSCSSLTSIMIPKSVTYLEGNVFQGCSGLSSIIVEEGNRNYDSRNNCNAIILNETLITGCKNTIIPDDVVSIGQYAFYSNKGLITLDIPNGVTSIDNQAFGWCTNLSSITLPSSLLSISGNAFYFFCILTSIIIPSNVTSIGVGAFEGCNINSVTSLIQEPFNINGAFSNIQDAILYVPKGTKSKYENTNGWNKFKNIVEIVKQCDKPSICYENGNLYFTCETEGAEYVTKIKDSDVKTHHDSMISLTATYNISVYATKEGYDNSDVATATLCWIDKEPQTEGITDGVSQISSRAVLVQSEGGIISLQGVDDGTQISAYTVDGVLAGTTISRNGGALLNTNLLPGTTAIIKVGEKSVKVVMK